MTKCYGHEECEFNGQPECRLPDGVPCPHGVTADKPAAESKTDIEALIERLNQYSQSLIVCQMGGEFSDVCLDAATALSTIQVKKAEMQKQLNEFSEFLCHIIGEMSSENEKLRAELEQVKREKDAAVSDIETIMAYRGGTCQFCGNGHCYARGGRKPCLPKWRGRKAE